MGFTVWGLAAAIAILLPNLLFFRLPPRDMPARPDQEPILLTVLENAGRLACFFYPILFGRNAAALPMDLLLFGMMACLALTLIPSSWHSYLHTKRKGEAH